MKLRDPKSGQVFESLEAASAKFCHDFLARAVYGECKAFCPLHEVNSPSKVPLCSSRGLASLPAETIARKMGYELLEA